MNCDDNKDNVLIKYTIIVSSNYIKRIVKNIFFFQFEYFSNLQRTGFKLDYK